jgi:Gram-negative bacterial TonB protein C-terminal
MRRLGPALLIVALLGAAARPAVSADAPSTSASPAASATHDRLGELVGTWSCRTAIAGTGRLVVEQPAPDTIVLRDERSYRYNTATQRETFRRDAASGGWHVIPDGAGFEGSGPAWSGDTWVLEGVFRSPALANPRRREMHLERLDADTLRMYWTLDKPEDTAQGELCRRGDVPPDASACVVPNAPAYVVQAVEPDIPVAAMEQRPVGTVRVVVSLDADSHVTGASVVQSPSVLLNGSAIVAARRSTYRTALRACKPVPSQYLFTVDYMS